MYDKYRLKYGEKLVDVAKRFNTSEDFLKEINNIYFNDYVRQGMDIIVPKTNDNYYNTYIIETGDSLYKIARKYNINPELLASINGLEEVDYIYPGQEILIPKSGFSYYITKDGDTIDTVMQMFNSNKEEFNKYNPTIYLMAGQLLVNKTK